ncbi:hypothetical protein AB0H00_02585 [Nocardia sp. NPDC023852]|uniref:hypothetical protein n=1 Tax=Nocardia sp. NPDC023852 TaxID=3154697 RepID=UPI0033ED5FAC
MRTRTNHRLTAERRSAAPRYIGLTEFANYASVDHRSLSRWRQHGPVWVPGPDVVLGEQERPGWTVECAEDWSPSVRPYVRAEPDVYLDTAQMKARHHLSYEVLWICIVVDKSLPMPAIWVDDKPGWHP